MSSDIQAAGTKATEGYSAARCLICPGDQTADRYIETGCVELRPLTRRHTGFEQTRPIHFIVLFSHDRWPSIPLPRR